MCFSLTIITDSMYVIGRSKDSDTLKLFATRQLNGVTFKGSPIDSLDDLSTTDAPMEDIYRNTNDHVFNTVNNTLKSSFD